MGIFSREISLPVYLNLDTRTSKCYSTPHPPSTSAKAGSHNSFNQNQNEARANRYKLPIDDDPIAPAPLQGEARFTTFTSTRALVQYCVWKRRSLGKLGTGNQDVQWDVMALRFGRRCRAWKLGQSPYADWWN